MSCLTVSDQSTSHRGSQTVIDSSLSLQQEHLYPGRWSCIVKSVGHTFHTIAGVSGEYSLSNPQSIFFSNGQNLLAVEYLRDEIGPARNAVNYNK